MFDLFQVLGITEAALLSEHFTTLFSQRGKYPAQVPVRTSFIGVAGINFILCIGLFASHLLLRRHGEEEGRREVDVEAMGKELS